MPEEEKKEKTAEKPASDGNKTKDGDGANEKKSEPAKDANQTKNESTKGKEDKADSKDKPDSTGQANKAGDDTNKDKAKEGTTSENAPAKPDSRPDDKSKEADKGASKPADKPAMDSETPSTEQKMRKPSIAVTGSGSDAEDLLKSAMQKARRASIRAKGRASSISVQNLLPQQASGRISTADMTTSLEADNVWELAVKMKQLTAELADPDEGQCETTLIVLGGKQSGKTTLIGQLLNSEDPAKRTLGLDYTYARRAGRGIGHDVCQIWELGGGTTFLQLLDTPVRAERLSDTACVIIVDLTHPETILPTVEATTKYLAELIDKKLKDAGTTGVLVRNLLTSQLDSRRPEGHPDTNAVKPLLIPLALVGGMYDKFQPMDVPDKKVVAESMRWAAHKHFASLLYFSSKEVALQSRAKDLLGHLAFGAEANPRQQLDVQKPLQIAAGTDSFRAIGAGGDGSLPYEVVLSHVSEKWPPQPEATGVPDDPSRDALFAEPEVDSLRAEKLQELDRLRQDLERRRKMALEREAAEKLKSKAPAAVTKQAAKQAAAEFLERHHSSLGEAKKEDKPAVKADAKKADAKKTDAKKADVKKMDAKKPDAKKADAKAEGKPAAKQATKPDAKADAKPAAKSDDKHNVKADAKPAAKPESKPDAKPAAKPATKADAKPAAKHDTKADAKPAAKSEAKPDAKPAAKK